MADYIDRQALREKMYHEAFEIDSDMQKWDSGCWIRYKLFENVIESIPVAEVKPILKGEWKEISGRYGWYCSNCKQENHYAYKYDDNDKIILQDFYCPNCGADMRENSIKY